MIARACLTALSAGLLAGVVGSAQAPSSAPTGELAGIVITAGDAPQPVGRAVVSLWGGAQPLGYHTVTDDTGRFEIAGLPAGRYSLSANRPAYVSITYGASRPGWAGTPIELTPGQQLTDLHVLLAKGAAIAGMVRGASGEPLRDVEVDLSRRSLPSIPAFASRTARTDDQGAYRFFGLAAGTYIVSARPEKTGSPVINERSDAEVDAIFRRLQNRTAGQPLPAPATASVSEKPRQLSDFVPVYYSRAFSSDDAWPVEVRAGDERTGIDLTVELMASSNLAGFVTGVNQETLAQVDLTLARASGNALASGRVQPDGAFLFSSIAPGRYRVVARVLSPERQDVLLGRSAPVQPGTVSPRGLCLVAVADVALTGASVPQIALPLEPCPTIAGQIEFHGDDGPTPADLSGVRITLAPESSPDGRVGAAAGVSTVSTSASFRLGDVGELVPGRYFVRVDQAATWRGAPWMVESVTIEGRDALDQSFDIADQRDAMRMIVTLTSRRTSLSGRLELPDGRPATDFVVVAFTTNRADWRPPFRQVLAARPATDGQYAIQNLPPGEYYLAALSDVAPDEWLDPSLLAEMVPSALRVTIAPGQAVIQGLRMLRGPSDW